MNQTAVLIVAVTVLTCSSLFGYYFLQLFASAALVSRRAGPWARSRYAVLAALAFGLSFGSGWLLNYLLAHT